jgi:hypothetical protein
VPADDLARLRELVLADPALQRRLLATAGRQEFVARVVALAAERGLDLKNREVDDALTERRREWYSRWI